VSIATIAAQAFSPNKLASLELWLDATEPSTIIESGGFVSEWKDRSKQGNHALQTTGVSQPVTGVNTINGKNVIAFDGVNDQLIVPRVVDTDWTIIVVYRPLVAGGGSNQWYFGDGLFDMEVGGSTGDFGLSVGSDADLLAGIGAPDTTIVKQTVGIDTNYVGVFTREASSGDIKLYVNGSAPVTGNAATSQRTAANRITIGSIQTDTRYFNGYIAEIIAYSQVLSDFDRNQVENYLANRWRINTFFPTILPGLNLWLDAADTSTIIESGGFVSEWQDKSLEGNDAQQLIGVSQPTTGINTINGLNTIAFDGINDYLNGAAGTVTIPFGDRTIFFVAHLAPSNSSDCVLSWDANGASGSANNDTEAFCFIFTIPDTGDLLAVKNYNVFTLIESRTEDRDVLVNMTIVSGGDLVTRLNGQQTSSILLVRALDDLDDFVIGAIIRAGVLDDFLEMDLGELIIYDRALSISEVEEVESYLADKWDLDIIFPIAFSEDFSTDFS